MLNSHNKAPICVVVTVVLALSAHTALAQEALAGKQTDAFIVVHDLLGAFYPEVFGRDRYVHFSTGHPVDGAWNEVYGIELEIKRFSHVVPSHPTFDATTGEPIAIPTPENTIFLEGWFWFDGKGGILQASFHGDEAHSKQNEGIHQLVESHSKWSEADALRALKEAGAAYGPAEKERFLEAAQLSKLERVLGKITIRSAEFSVFGNPEHEGNFAELYWRVDVDSHSSDGPPVTYVLNFEPFQGKLTGILRQHVKKD